MTLAEREWHKLLTSVQGVGAKAALAIQGTLGSDGVGRAIALGDMAAVKAAPGVGPKLAQRVVNELKEKAPAVMSLGTEGTQAAKGPSRREDAVIIDDDMPPPPPTAPSGDAAATKSEPSGFYRECQDALRGDGPYALLWSSGVGQDDPCPDYGPRTWCVVSDDLWSGSRQGR